MSAIEKLTYLNSYLESMAAEAIAGLTLTAVNYKEAVAKLKKRFGNTLLTGSKHSVTIQHLSQVISHNDLKGRRCLYDSAETHVRGLQSPWCVFRNITNAAHFRSN